MEFDFCLNPYFIPGINDIKKDALSLKINSTEYHGKLDHIRKILDQIGFASARAQSILNPVTSYMKFLNSDHVLYLLVDYMKNEDRGMIIGFLKMGWKKLYVFDSSGLFAEKRCFCCLDFYVHETKQRQGYGKYLFDHMLKENSLSSSKIPIDRPSGKLLKFLKKHYQLEVMIPQWNHFAIFEQFFED